MSKIKIENIVLEFGNRLLGLANSKENPTLGKLIDKPVKAIQKHVSNTTIKEFVYTHSDKPDEFTLGLSAGYIDEEGHICQQQMGAESTFAVGMPVYDEQYHTIGCLSIGLFKSLDYAEKTSDGLDIPVYFWKVEGYEGKRQNIKTYYQKLDAELQTSKDSKAKAEK